MRNGLVVIIRTVTGVAHDHPLLPSKLLLLCSCNTPDNIILLSCRLWHLWAMAWLARCLWCTVADHLSHVVCREFHRSTTVLSKHLWWPHSNYPVNKKSDLVGIWQLHVTSEALYNSVLHL